MMILGIKGKSSSSIKALYSPQMVGIPYLIPSSLPHAACPTDNFPKHNPIFIDS